MNRKQKNDKVWNKVGKDRRQLEALKAAIEACLPDLEHYAATHGTGPDVRLAALKGTLTA